MNRQERPSEYVILYRKGDNQTESPQVLIGHRNVISFEAIGSLLSQPHISKSFVSLLKPTFRLEIGEDGRVPNCPQLGRRLAGTILPTGGQWSFPGGRSSNGPGGLAKFLLESGINYEEPENQDLYADLQSVQSHVRAYYLHISIIII